MLTTVYKMKEYPLYARPRERMEMLGAEQLTDQELLAILLATGSKEGSAMDLAEQLLQRHEGLSGLRTLSLAELMEQKGIGVAKATTIAAAIELGRRIHAGGGLRNAGGGAGCTLSQG